MSLKITYCAGAPTYLVYENFTSMDPRCYFVSHKLSESK